MSAPLLVVMGVSGSGKSTAAQAVSARLGWPWIEGDDHHSAGNISKMTAGRPLTDGDRAAWAGSIVDGLDMLGTEPVVLACSALTVFVQSALAGSGRTIIWCWLDLPEAVLTARLVARQGAPEGHFMPASLLGTQLSALHIPAGAHRIDGCQTPDEICADICALTGAADLA